MKCAVRSACAPFLLLLLLPAWISHAAEWTWRNVSPADLAPNGPLIEPDAAAEILFWRVDIDDRDFPVSRRRKEYMRFKILNPEKAAKCTELSRVYVTTDSFGDDVIDLRARMTLPDGSTRDFGADAIRQRDVARSAAADSWTGRLFGRATRGMKEKFLAVSGVVAGAVIDYQIDEIDRHPSKLDITYGQREEAPVRRFEWQLRVGGDSSYGYDQFAFNAGAAKFVRSDNGKTVSITADQLPSRYREEYSGALLDTTFAVVNSCTPLELAFIADGVGNWEEEFTTKAGPWAPYASIMSVVAETFSKPTRKVKATARQLVAGAGSDLEKMRRLHAYTQERQQRYLRMPEADSEADRATVDDLLDDRTMQTVRADDLSFTYLEIALAKAEHLNPRLLLLPDRDLKLFDPQVVCSAFLDEPAVGYVDGNRWHVSFPTSTIPRPFDQLPWRHEGVPALVVEREKQTFVELPVIDATVSTTKNFALLRLSAEGDLAGACRTYYSGHDAAAMRLRLHDKTDVERRALLTDSYREALRAETVTITSVTGIDAADAPLEVNYHVQFPGYAVAAGNRLIFKPAVFHWHEEPLFGAEKRTQTVILPYCWSVRDRLQIQLPPGFEPETKESPPSYAGKALHHTVSIWYDPQAHRIEFGREWAINTISVPVKAYAALNKWCAAVAASDRTEMVLVRGSRANGASASATAQE